MPLLEDDDNELFHALAAEGGENEDNTFVHALVPTDLKGLSQEEVLFRGGALADALVDALVGG